MTMTMPTPQAVGGANVVTVNGRRSLLIGLGTSGAKVCNQILERLSWTYEKPENVPWVKCLVFDTATIPADRAPHADAAFTHLKIGQDEYAALITNPQLFKSNLDFPSWKIDGLIGTTDAIIDGAKNTRFLGRLAVLFPSNFNAITRNIRLKLDELLLLANDPVGTSETFAKGFKSRVNVELSAEIYVYVIGSLCGGTAGGSFIDFGYILKSLPGYTTQSTGIFMLPPDAPIEPIQLGNTVSALVELNHYSSDRSRYSAQFPDRAGMLTKMPAGERPYKHLYLVQSPGPSKQEYGRLLTTTADYIYADLLGSSATVRDNKRTDIASYFMQRDTFGATQKYYTFSLGIVEFPITKVLKACSLKLARRGFQLLLGGEEMTDSATSNLISSISLLDRQELIRHLLVTASGEALASRINAALDEAKVSAYRSDTALDLINRQLDAAFGTPFESPLPNLKQGIVGETVEENARKVGASLHKSIQELLASLFTPGNIRGISAADELLTAIKYKLSPAASSVGINLSELKHDMDVALQNAIECRRDSFLKVMLQTEPAVRRYVDEFIDMARDVYSRRLMEVAAPTADAILEHAKEYVERLHTRLVNDSVGLRSEVHAIMSLMDQVYTRTDIDFNQATDGWSRAVNGVELFEPGVTVEQEYARCIQQTAIDRNIPGNMTLVEDRLAVAATASYLESAFENWFAHTNRSGRYDPDRFRQRPDVNEADIMEITRGARGPFEAIKNISIIDRLLDSNNPQATITKVKMASPASGFLDWNENHPRYIDQPNKRYSYIFYNDKHPRNLEFRHLLEENGLFGIDTETSAITDRHQLMVLREHGAFSLGTIKTLSDDELTRWWSIYLNPPGIASFHARGDESDWVSWRRVEEEERGKSVVTFLLACALRVVEFQNTDLYVFRYKSTRPSDDGFVEFTSDLDQTVRIMRSRDLVGLVGLKNREWRALNGNVAVIERVIEFISREADNQFRDGDSRLSKEDVEDYLLDYVLTDTDLAPLYYQQFPNEVENSYIRVEGGRTVYVCPNEHCGKRLGFSPASLYILVDEGGRTVRKRECPYCRKAIP